MRALLLAVVFLTTLAYLVVADHDHRHGHGPGHGRGPPRRDSGESDESFDQGRGHSRGRFTYTRNRTQCRRGERTHPTTPRCTECRCFPRNWLICRTDRRCPNRSSTTAEPGSTTQSGTGSTGQPSSSGSTTTAGSASPSVTTTAPVR